MDEIQFPLLISNQDYQVHELSLERMPANELLVSLAPEPGLIADIAVSGQLLPILVSFDGDTTVVIDGRRRIKALRILHGRDPENPLYNKVRCIFVNADMNGAMIASSAANNLRSENPLSDLVVIDYVLSKAPNISMAQLSRLTRIKRQRLHRRLKLKRLLPDLYNAILKGQISIATAESAASLPVSLQEKLLPIVYDGKTVTLKDVQGAQRVRVQSTIQDMLPEMPVLEPTKTLRYQSGLLSDLLSQLSFDITEEDVIDYTNDRFTIQITYDPTEDQYVALVAGLEPKKENEDGIQ